MTDLADLAADALDDGRNPFEHQFLADNDITFDECMSLAGIFATGGRLFAYALDHPNIARGAVTGAHTAAAYEALNTALEKWRP
jgi:hypothetical protein